MEKGGREAGLSRTRHNGRQPLSPKKSLLTLAQGSSRLMMLTPKKTKKTPMAAK